MHVENVLVCLSAGIACLRLPAALSPPLGSPSPVSPHPLTPSSRLCLTLPPATEGEKKAGLLDPAAQGGRFGEASR